MNLVLALAATVFVAQTPRPQLVVLPLLTPKAETQPALTAWNAVVSTLNRRSKVLRVSMTQQRAQHDVLIGPAREQAKDCGRDVDCLAEIGAALGADFLVLGVASSRIALLAVRVQDRTVMAKARSSTKGTVEKRARQAANRLAKRLRKALRNGTKPKKRVPRAQAPTESRTPAAATDSAPPTASAPAAAPPAEGLLYIHRDQLAGVTQLTLDGEPVAFTGEGFVSWSAASGEHSLRAVHIDGRVLVKPIFLQAGQTTEVALGFPPAALPPPPLVATTAEGARDDDGDNVLGTWWFWTIVGSVVAASAATAVVLASGAKGGPTPSDETGVIEGSY